MHPVGGGVPRQLSRILRYALQPDRDAALASAQELEEALQRWVERYPRRSSARDIPPALLGRASQAIDRRPVALPIFAITLLLLIAASLVTSALALASAFS